jgi:hypothetical protein
MALRHLGDEGTDESMSIEMSIEELGLQTGMIARWARPSDLMDDFVAGSQP